MLAFKQKAPAPPEGYENHMASLYTAAAGAARPKKPFRAVPQQPERILDAPDLVDDYYLNLLDWGATNTVRPHTDPHCHCPTPSSPHYSLPNSPVTSPLTLLLKPTTHTWQVSVALNQSVYLWNASSGDIQQLLTCQGDDYVTSLSWAADGKHIAVGFSNALTQVRVGANACYPPTQEMRLDCCYSPTLSPMVNPPPTRMLQIWDAESIKPVRNLTGHAARVSSLSWNNHTLSTGSRDTNILNHDVRMREHVTATLRGHEQEVCGLKWSPNGTQLASGGNDNMLAIWDAAADRPTQRITAHQAAVKALDWCPFQSNLLASGGGTADRTIKFWNTHTGAMLNSIDTGSQVCALQWSRHEREILSSHGFR